MEFIYVSALVIAGKDFMLYICRLYGTDTGNVAIACRASDVSRVKIPVIIYFSKLLLNMYHFYLISALFPKKANREINPFTSESIEKSNQN